MLIMVASNIRFHLKMTFLHSTGRNFNLAPSHRKKTSSNLIMGSNPNFVTTVCRIIFPGFNEAHGQKFVLVFFTVLEKYVV